MLIYLYLMHRESFNEHETPVNMKWDYLLSKIERRHTPKTKGTTKWLRFNEGLTPKSFEIIFAFFLLLCSYEGKIPKHCFWYLFQSRGRRERDINDYLSGGKYFSRSKNVFERSIAVYYLEGKDVLESISEKTNCAL